LPLLARFGGQFAAESLEECLHGCGGDSLGVDGCAEQPIDFAQRQGYWLAFCRAPFHGGDDDVDQIAFDVAADSKMMRLRWPRRAARR
jgi:hypothetical protein